MVEFKQFKGDFVKRCPCSPETVSCGYYNLNLHTGCPFDCSYCILQTYLESKKPVFYTNLTDFENEFQNFLPNKNKVRIGTGELSDSLAYDDETQYSIKILNLIKRYPRVVFEFKTKSKEIKNLINFPTVLKNVVVGWSLNPREIIAREEYKTPGLNSRLKAISAVLNRGYMIAVHFDPIIFTKNWKVLYQDLVKSVADVIQPAKIAWWSMGALRFPAALRKHIFSWPDSNLFAGELIKGYDNKYRYFKPLRMEMFNYIKKLINSRISKEVPLYLCMEDEETWKAILPEIEPKPEVINEYLYDRVYAEKSK
jgi:spore photoproduct lyase